MTCQDPTCDAVAEYKVKEWSRETGEIFRYWYLCILHVKTYFGPWLPRRFPS